MHGVVVERTALETCGRNLFEVRLRKSGQGVRVIEPVCCGLSCVRWFGLSCCCISWLGENPGLSWESGTTLLARVSDTFGATVLFSRDSMFCIPGVKPTGRVSKGREKREEGGWWVLLVRY